jgi:hypothetical protein
MQNEDCQYLTLNFNKIFSLSKCQHLGFQEGLRAEKGPKGKMLLRISF